MYERSAILLERYFNNLFGFDKKINLKHLYKSYKEIIEEIQKYQLILEEEDDVINEFDEAANEIRSIQQEQKRIYKNNIKLEEERNQLFDSVDEEASTIEKKLVKIEENIERNNKRLEELREEFIKSLTKFNEKQKERNTYSRNRREEEKNHIQIVEKANENMNEIDKDILKDLKAFINSTEDVERKEIADIMISNGKDERVPFNKNVIESSARVRCEIAKREAECYLIIYDRMRKLLLEVNNDEIKIDKYIKALRDVSVKLAFLKAQKMYIVSFLDYERMTAINGLKAHKQMMEDACEKFELDMEQFNNLYELILKETAGKSTKKAYKELYNKEYLKNIEEKEKSFEKEVNNIKLKAGTIINSNYWRIDEIRNIYDVFEKEISEKFDRDLSEFSLEPVQELVEDENDDEVDDIVNYDEVNDEVSEDTEFDDDDIFRTDISDDDAEYVEEYEYDEDDEDEYEYEDDEYDDEEDYEYDEEEYEDDDEEDDSDEYEEDSDDYYDSDDEYDEDEEYDDEDDEEYEDDEDDELEDDEDDNDEPVENDLEKSKKGKGIFNKLFKDKKD